MTYLTDLLAREAESTRQRVERLEAAVARIERAPMAHRMTVDEYIGLGFDACDCESPVCPIPLHFLPMASLLRRLGQPD